jgi:hypothetical protein
MMPRRDEIGRRDLVAVHSAGSPLRVAPDLAGLCRLDFGQRKRRKESTMEASL